MTPGDQPTFTAAAKGIEATENSSSGTRPGILFGRTRHSHITIGCENVAELLAEFRLVDHEYRPAKMIDVAESWR